MRERRAYHPLVFDSLEDRVVPAQSAASTPAALVLGTPVLGTLRGSDPVLRAVDDFVRQYLQAVRDVLLAPGPDGTISPSANRAAFNARVHDDLVTLTDRIAATLDGSTNSAGLSAQVREQIVGSGADSLESRLAALPTPTAVDFQGSSVRSLTAVAVATTRQATQDLSTVILEAQGPSPVRTAAGAPTPTTLGPERSLISPSSPAGNEIRSAFGSFLQSYFQAFKSYLANPATAGEASPASRRAAFDAEVGSALATLHGAIAKPFAGLPQGHAPDVLTPILGTGPNSLRAQLAAIPTPDLTQSDAARSFSLQSVQAISNSLSMLSGDYAATLRWLGMRGE